jgi:hypothetical protein
MAAHLADLPAESATAQPQVVCRPSSRQDISQLLSEFASATLAQLDTVALLNRVDTKYLLTLPQLHAALAAQATDYAALHVDAQERASVLYPGERTTLDGNGCGSRIVTDQVEQGSTAEQLGVDDRQTGGVRDTLPWPTAFSSQTTKRASCNWCGCT